jgi:hypothetical protein
MRMVIKRHRTGWVVWDTLRNKPHDVRPIDKARAQALADGINARLDRVAQGFRRA